MCGIVGFIDTTRPVDFNLLQILNESMIARGPDGDGFYTPPATNLGMAMRRLSVIDLEGGWQPLFSEDDRVAAMQNGEIYNHRELRLELEQAGHRFRTRSDTEVLAHGYEQWGIEGLLDRIDGMYALAIYDHHARQLHLARDRFGEKPLYYHAAPGRFVYGSQLLTVASYLGVDDRWSAEGLYWYLALHFVPGERTVLRGVNKLPPGHRITVDVNTAKHSIHRYWRLDEGRERTVKAEQLLDLLDRAVRSRLIADVPVGLFLSGGLDSSVLTALTVRHAPRVATFSMGFATRAVDESPHAEEVARALGTRHHHFEFDERSFRNLLPRVVKAMDEPVGDQAMLPLYWLCQEARRTVKVVLSGEGADELFGGYSYYNQATAPARTWRNWFRRQKSAGVSHVLLPNCQTPSGFPLLTNEQERLALTGLPAPPPECSWYAETLAHLNQTRDSVRRACLADVQTWLAEDLLMKFDKMAMGHSLEGRAPYLQPGLAQAAFNAPQHQKITGHENKRVLREVARRLLPESICDRPKQGFVLPMRAWLADYLTGEVPRLLFNEIDMGLDPEQTVRLVREDVQAGVERERWIYAMVVLAHWAEHARAEIRRTRNALPAVAQVA